MHEHQIMLITRKNLRTERFYKEAEAYRLVKEAQRNQPGRNRLSLRGIIQRFKPQKSSHYEQIPEASQHQTILEQA